MQITTQKFYGHKKVRLSGVTTETDVEIRALALDHAGETDGANRSHMGVTINRLIECDGEVVVTINTD